MKKIKVKLKDIHILNGTHNAKWVVLDTFQGFIGKDELKRIYSAEKNDKVYKKRLIHKIK